MNTIDFFKKLKQQLELNLPFVVYCKPNSNSIIALLQQNDVLYEVLDYTEKGFVFASFDGTQTFLIPENQSEIIATAFDEKELIVAERAMEIPDATAKNYFENLVSKGVRAIENGEFKKVVVSRKEVLDLIDFDLVFAFQNTVLLYPTTFTYCFFHPKVGTWLGATPEQLLKAENNTFQTIALAGTQKHNGSEAVVWEIKEQDEQQLVTDYILAKLENVASQVSVTNPYSFKAGNIWHIKTEISGILKSGCGLQQVVGLLHPTPAVCGMPKDQSKAFILENENYGRTFYTGFLGELNSSLSPNSISSDLFVNLRCMRICGSQAYLYMGCGITKDSIPEKEWEESINKSLTMKKVLDCRV